MILLHPIFLLLALPLAIALWTWGFRSRVMLALRVLTLTCIVLMLAGLAARLPSQAGAVIVIADRSHSLPEHAESSQKDLIQLLQTHRHGEDRLGVVAFGRDAVIEQAPDGAPFAGFVHEVGRDASNLAEAMEMGLSLIPRDAPGRLVVLSDGQWTGRDPSAVAARAAERGIAVDYRVLQRTLANDIAIVRVDAPSSVQPQESFLITAWAHSPKAEEVQFDLRRGTVRLAGGKRKLEAGLNRLTFRDQAQEPGTQVYALSVAADKADDIMENNAARFLVGVEGDRPLLVVTSSPKSSFPALLAAGGVNVKASVPERCVWNLEELSKYSGVILENVPGDKLGFAGMETLAAWVQHTGSGLMMTGGRASYASGGYFKSPLEPLLPVSMELRQEHRKLSIAIVVALDRSGSMAVPVAGGRVKMDLANLGTAQVIDLLAPTDEFGCIAIDSAPHTIQELGLLRNRAAVRERVLKINSEGGGIYIFEALEASLAMIRTAKAGTRHIILFSDAADAEEPKHYQRLLAQCRAEGITVSVIGLGKESDKDGDLLKDIAKLGGGRVFFTDRPDELPRLFAQDTFVVARSSFLDEATPIKTTVGLASLTSKVYEPPQLGGYNLCYLRPQANLAAVTLDEYKAPVVASWHSGAGRVVCYTGEVDGKYTGAMSGWKDLGDFYATMACWTAGRSRALPDGAILTQARHKGIATIKLHLDPDRKGDSLTKLPEVRVLRATGNQAPKAENLRMHWTDADTLAVSVPLHGTETTLPTIDIPGHGPVMMPPLCLPYSPEYEPPPIRVPDDTKSVDAATPSRGGAAALEEIARMTGGRERVDAAHLWEEMPRHARLMPLAPYLLVVACVAFLLEILERLTGILSRISWHLRFAARSPSVSASASHDLPAARTRKEASPPVTLSAAQPTPSSVPLLLETPAPSEVSKPDLLDALRQVQKKRQKP